jgi:DNA-binding LacI/PurR family transcriptional regulator/DNA-binding transcriptional regulator YhcF (GntR family)
MEASLTDRCAGRLRNEILSGSLNARKGLITERALCQKLKVSRVTVRRCLALLQNENLLRSIPYKGYVLGPAAHASRDNNETDSTARRDLLLFVQSPSSRPLLSTVHERYIWEGVAEEAARFGLKAQPCRMPLKSLLREIKAYAMKNLFGVALEWFDREAAETLLSEGIPAVLVEYVHEGVPLDAVCQDDESGMEQTIERLWSLGHRRLGLIAWSEQIFQPLRRRASFCASLLRRGVVEPCRMGLTDRFDHSGGREAVTKLFDRDDPPTALILCHPEHTAGVFDELDHRGLCVPRDVSVVAWGTPETQAAWLEHTRWAHEKLDLITWSRREMGQLVVRALQSRTLNPLLPPMRIHVPTKLVLNGSSVEMKDANA